MDEFNSGASLSDMMEAYAGKMSERLAAWEAELLSAANQEADLKDQLTNFHGVGTFSTMSWLNGMTPGERILHESGVRDQQSVVEDEWWDIQFGQDDERWDLPADEFYAIEERSEWRDYSMGRGEYSEYEYDDDYDFTLE